MNQPQQHRASDTDLALDYLAQVAGTYAKSLNDVERAPFVAHVNQCLQVIRTEVGALQEALKAARRPAEAEQE